MEKKSTPTKKNYKNYLRIKNSSIRKGKQVQSKKDSIISSQHSVDKTHINISIIQGMLQE